ncbi:MAG: hypothetical protein AAB415_02640, partial [Patescibacteria group bacterium]
TSVGALGALTVSGLSTLSQASTTRLSVFDRLYIGGTSTTTIVGDNATSTFSGAVGVNGTSTPWGRFSVELDTYNPGLVVANTGSSTPAFYIGGVNQNGRIGLGTASPNEQLELTGNLRLPVTTGAGAGVIYSGTDPFLHSYGNSNIFLGVSTGNFTTTGAGANFGLGTFALNGLTSGDENTAIGSSALSLNTIGSQNTALGSFTGGIVTTGVNNTFLGYGADVNLNSISSSTAIGYNAIVGRDSSIVLGGTGAFAVNVGIGTTSPYARFALELDTQDAALVVANQGSSTPAFYIGGVNQDGRVGVGTTTDQTSQSRTFNVAGNWGGNSYVDAGAYTSTQTVTVPNKALIYHLTNNIGTTDVSITVTYNITGLPNTEGTFAYIYTFAQKGITAGSRQSVVTIQINGAQVSTIATLNSTSAQQSFESYAIGYSNGAWHAMSDESNSDLSDLAEWIESVSPIPQAGELVSLADTPIKVRRASEVYDEKLVGIVSTAPHTVMGEQTPTAIPLTLAGRVPVKVTAENGDIEIGDYLTSSSIAGVAMKATRAGRVVGRALESYDEDGVGSILVFVELDYWPGPAPVALDLAALLASPAGLVFGGDITIKGDAIFFGRPYFTTDTAGFAMIKKGAKEVRITYDREYLETPVVNITPEGLLDRDTRYGLSDSSATGFTIKLSSRVPADIKFNWLALAVKNAKIFTSEEDEQIEEDNKDNGEPPEAPVSTPDPIEEAPTPTPEIIDPDSVPPTEEPAPPEPEPPPIKVEETIVEEVVVEVVPEISPIESSPVEP